MSQQKAALTGKLERARAACSRPRDIPGVVVVFPVLGGRFERYPHRELHRAVVEAAEGAGLAAVDLLDCYSAYGFRDLRVDVVHPSPLGHRVAAHATRDALCARGWLCAGVPPGPRLHRVSPRRTSRPSGVTDGPRLVRGYPIDWMTRDGKTSALRAARGPYGRAPASRRTARGWRSTSRTASSATSGSTSGPARP